MNIDKYDRFARQTEYFMMRCMSLLIPYLERGRYTLLDLGARSGHGSGLVKRMFEPGGGLGIEIEVSACNLTQEENIWFKSNDWGIEPFILDAQNGEDFLKSGQKYDIVICSHMIEHTTNPQKVMSFVNDITNKFFVIACPWKEKKLDHGDWHHDSSIDEDVLLKYRPAKNFVSEFDPGYPLSPCIYAIYSPR